MPPVELALRDFKAKLCLIAANKSDRPESIRFTGASVTGRRVRILNEIHSSAIEADTLVNDFTPFAVHLYELDKRSTSSRVVCASHPPRLLQPEGEWRLVKAPAKAGAWQRFFGQRCAFAAATAKPREVECLALALPCGAVKPAGTPGCIARFSALFDRMPRLQARLSRYSQTLEKLWRGCGVASG
jgi:hypothetical protein